jgi:hypothetical protein
MAPWARHGLRNPIFPKKSEIDGTLGTARFEKSDFSQKSEIDGTLGTARFEKSDFSQRISWAQAQIMTVLSIMIVMRNVLETGVNEIRD